jgi:hypothetical protein
MDSRAAASVLVVRALRPISFELPDTIRQPNRCAPLAIPGLVAVVLSRTCTT